MTSEVITNADSVMRSCGVIDAEAVDRRCEKIIQATDANERKDDQGREVTYKGQQDKYDQIGERRCDQGHVQPKIQAGHCRERNKAEQETSCFALPFDETTDLTASRRRRVVLVVAPSHVSFGIRV